MAKRITWRPCEIGWPLDNHKEQYFGLVFSFHSRKAARVGVANVGRSYAKAFSLASGY